MEKIQFFLTCMCKSIHFIVAKWVLVVGNKRVGPSSRNLGSKTSLQCTLLSNSILDPCSKNGSSNFKESVLLSGDWCDLMVSDATLMPPESFLTLDPNIGVNSLGQMSCSWPTRSFDFKVSLVLDLGVNPPQVYKLALKCSFYMPKTWFVDTLLEVGVCI